MREEDACSGLVGKNFFFMLWVYICLGEPKRTFDLWTNDKGPFPHNFIIIVRVYQNIANSDAVEMTIWELTGRVKITM